MNRYNLYKSVHQFIARVVCLKLVIRPSLNLRPILALSLALALVLVLGQLWPNPSPIALALGSKL